MDIISEIDSITISGEAAFRSLEALLREQRRLRLGALLALTLALAVVLWRH